MRRSTAIFLVLMAAACGGRQNFNDAEFPARSVSVGGKVYNYRIYIPRNRDTSVPVPVMLYLHGSGARGNDNYSQLDDLPSFIREHPERFPFVIVLPQCEADTFWAGPMMEQAIAALDRTVIEFKGDPNRLYLAGYSMGGFGVWQTAVTYPNKFAALVPIAGGIKPQGPVSDDQKELLSPAVRKAAESDDPYKAFAAAIGKTPVWAFHGGADGVVSPEGTRQMIAALKANGDPNVVYTEFENVGHESLINTFSEPGLFEWMGRQELTTQ